MRFDYNYLGIMDYNDSMNLMDQKISESVQQKKAYLMGLEYEKIFTAGLTFSEDHLLHKETALVKTRRGGSVTLHNRGQLIVYTILPFDYIQRDLPEYLRTIEKTIINYLSIRGIPSYTIEGKTGVFTDWGKIAYIGISVKKNTVYHGFALNFQNDLSDYDVIHSCGLTIPNTSIKKTFEAIINKNDQNAENMSITDGFDHISGLLIKKLREKYEK